MGYQLIETIEVGSGGAASIEFTSIPQDGVSLVVLCSLRVTNNSGESRIRLNNSTTGYSAILLYGDGSSAGSYSTSSTYIQLGDTQYSATANTFASVQVTIPNYTSSSAKSTSSENVSENNGTLAYQNVVAGSWTGTAAIASLQILGSSSFVQHSTASLYKVTAD
jgi:hypothetical protein